LEILISRSKFKFSFLVIVLKNLEKNNGLQESNLERLQELKDEFRKK